MQSYSYFLNLGCYKTPLQNLSWSQQQQSSLTQYCILPILLHKRKIFFYNNFIAALHSNRGYMNSSELIQACNQAKLHNYKT